jgi:hypothetical protein
MKGESTKPVRVRSEEVSVSTTTRDTSPGFRSSGPMLFPTSRRWQSARAGPISAWHSATPRLNCAVPVGPADAAKNGHSVNPDTRLMFSYRPILAGFNTHANVSVWTLAPCRTAAASVQTLQATMCPRHFLATLGSYHVTCKDTRGIRA